MIAIFLVISCSTYERQSTFTLPDKGGDLKYLPFLEKKVQAVIQPLITQDLPPIMTRYEQHQYKYLVGCMKPHPIGHQGTQAERDSVPHATSGSTCECDEEHLRVMSDSGATSAKHKGPMGIK